MKKLLKELRENKIHISLYEEDIKLKFDGAKPSLDLISKIRENKENIIKYLKQESKRSSIQSVIPKTPILDDGYPLSSSQYRLWILSQFEEGLRAYNITHQIELNGGFDIDLFKKSVCAVVERHEILRTVFRKNKEGEIRQFILPFEEIGFEIAYKDFRNEVNQRKAISNFVSQDTYKIFDLENGPLLTTMLFQLADDQYVFHYNMHHIIGDGWSMGVLAKDTLDFYNSYISPNAETVSALKIQYKDFAAWQSARIKSQELDNHKAYWLKQLSDDLPILDLPTNLQRPTLKTNKGQILETFLSKELSSKIKIFTRQNKGTLFTSLLTFWNILFYRYTGQKDIVIGSPVAGREHLDLEDQIGFYVNTIALRNVIDPKISIKENYETLNQKTLSDLSHQAYPFDLLVDELNLSRDTSRSAIFDVMLALQNTGEKESDEYIQSEVGKIYDRGVSMTKFDVEINFAEVGSMLLFKVNFNTDVYERHMIEQLMQHFSQLVEKCIDYPDLQVNDIEFLTELEQKEHIDRYNYSKVAFPKEKTIVDLFYEKAQQYPDNIALTCENNSLTYQQLDELSNQLAQYLQAQCNINSDDLIGVQLDRNEWIIIAILGILKAGGAYVPIDNDLPQERIDYMIEDSNCKLLLNQDEVDKFFNTRDKYSINQVANSIRPNSLAYVIYTSGTTGKPKGTLLEHRNVVRLLFNDENRFDFNAEDVWCLFHAYCFDFSVWEIFGALLYGGKLVVVPKETTRDMNRFSKLLEMESVTVLNQTPTAFKMLQEEVFRTQTKLAARYLIFGGEALNTDTLEKWKKEFPSCKIINMYGITETTVHVTYKEITEEDIQSTVSNIGVPIPTLGTIVLDENQKIVPEGVMGELCVYGKGLARSYLNKPDLTNDRFIDYENKILGKVRIYKSGDFVKVLPNGDLAYLSRIDKQVKIRGHRIELGEIETAIRSAEEIKDCVVYPKNNKEGKTLVAYLVYESDKLIEKAILKKYLQKHLPEYMIPGFYVVLDQIPLTSNGKVNRKMLPDITDGDIIKSEYVQPQNEMEEMIIEIIKEELEGRVARVGVTDNFFDLGLDSFSLITILNKINSRLAIELKALDLFKYPNVQSLIQNVLNLEVEEDLHSVNISEDIDSMVDIF